MNQSISQINEKVMSNLSKEQEHQYMTLYRKISNLEAFAKQCFQDLDENKKMFQKLKQINKNVLKGQDINMEDILRISKEEIKLLESNIVRRQQLSKAESHRIAEQIVNLMEKQKQIRNIYSRLQKRVYQMEQQIGHEIYY